MLPRNMFRLWHLRANEATELQAAAQKAGAKLVVSETALLDHLPELLNQALQVE